MPDKFDWSDVPVLLAFGRTGTIADAATALGMDETTAARRLKRLESSLGAPLVNKSRGKLTLTAVGKLAIDRAQRMAEAASLLTRDQVASPSDISGTVRMRGPTYLLNLVVIPTLSTLLNLHPRLTLQFMDGDGDPELDAEATDIAIAMAAPRGTNTSSHRLGTMAFAAYRPRTQFRGVSWHRCAWIGAEAGRAEGPEGRWLSANIPQERIAVRTYSTGSRAAAVRAGLGCAVLPVLIGENDRDMVRMQSGTLLKREMWLLWRSETAFDRAVCASVAHLKLVFQEFSSQFEG